MPPARKQACPQCHAHRGGPRAGAIPYTLQTLYPTHYKRYTLHTTNSSQASSSEAEAAADGAARLTAGCHAARQFTDTASFTLRCGVCALGLVGEKEAVEHAKATGHQNFTEY